MIFMKILMKECIEQSCMILAIFMYDGLTMEDNSIIQSI